MARTNSGHMIEHKLEHKLEDQMKALYPAVNELETPIPRGWCTRERSTPLSFTKDNRRVEYKGIGKKKEAFNIQTANSIPPSCGLYYFEVKIISKGQEGFIGIGLSADNVNINKLPGWDKLTYSYHGDDGCIFCSSGAGQPYGPTFTTGDIIGCGVNFLDNTCFFTKNGHNLGLAFKDIQGNLYPTIGLQTPGQIIDTNFGQHPFEFDITDMIQGMKKKFKRTVENFSINENKELWHILLQSIIQSYLVHHGYCNTAQIFAKSTQQKIEEDLSSVKKRKKLQELLLNGQVGSAIEMTKELYPVLFEKDINLQFMLECQHFIEVVKNTSNTNRKLPNVQQNIFTVNNIKRSNCTESKFFTYSNKKLPKVENDIKNLLNTNDSLNYRTNLESTNTSWFSSSYFNNSNTLPVILPTSVFSTVSNIPKNESYKSITETTHSEYNSNKVGTEKMLQLGRKLNTMNNWMKSIPGYSEINNDMLQDVFSLVAYADPANSPLGYLLHQSEREIVCDKVNSAILENLQFPRRSVLEVIIIHTRQLIRLMYSLGYGHCAFINVDELLH